MKRKKLKSTQQRESAFLELLEQHRKLINKLAYAYTKYAEERKDLVQEIILQLWKSFPRYIKKGTDSTWVYRVALNVCISWYRKEKSRRKKLHNYHALAENILWQDPKLEGQLSQLYACIDTLSALDKAIILMSLEGCKAKVIAKTMGITVSNVSTRIYRIKQQLSNCFKQKSEAYGI